MIAVLMAAVSDARPGGHGADANAHTSPPRTACFAAAVLLGAQAEWAFGHGERRFVRLIDGRVLEFRDGIARG
jgi:hypothetical protein